MSTAISLTLGRTLLGLGDLTLANGPADPVQFGEFTPSGAAWSLVTSSSPWVDGNRLRAASRTQGALDGTFYIVTAVGSAPATHDSYLASLLAALGQFAWSLTVTTVNGGGTLTRTYDCQPADATPDESVMVADSFNWTTVKVTIPHAPVPISGAW